MRHHTDAPAAHCSCCHGPGAWCRSSCVPAPPYSRGVLLLVLAGWLAAGATLGSRAERLAQAPPLRAAVLANSSRPPLGDRPQRGLANPSPRPCPGLSACDSFAAFPRPHDPRSGRHHRRTSAAGRDASFRRARALPSTVDDSHASPDAGAGRRRDADGAWHPCGSAHPRLACGTPAAAPGDGAGAGPLPRPRRAGPAALARPPRHRRSSDRSRAARWWRSLDHGSWLEERAAAARHRIRQLTSASVGSWDATTAAIVTAILIGDRAGLDDRIERDLQEAGTYHVIAISGGNIAILAGCLLLTCRCCSSRGAPGSR